MKKLLLLTAILGLSYSVQAQETQTKKTTTTTTTKVQTQDTAKTYAVIERNTLPVATLEKIGTKFGGYSIEQAHRAADGEYKLILVKGDSKTTAYFSRKGEFIRQD